MLLDVWASDGIKTGGGQQRSSSCRNTTVSTGDTRTSQPQGDRVSPTTSELIHITASKKATTRLRVGYGMSEEESLLDYSLQGVCYLGGSSVDR